MVKSKNNVEEWFAKHYRCYGTHSEAPRSILSQRLEQAELFRPVEMPCLRCNTQVAASRACAATTSEHRDDWWLWQEHRSRDGRASVPLLCRAQRWNTGQRGTEGLTELAKPVEMPCLRCNTLAKRAKIVHRTKGQRWHTGQKGRCCTAQCRPASRNQQPSLLATSTVPDTGARQALPSREAPGVPQARPPPPAVLHCKMPSLRCATNEASATGCTCPP